MNQTIKNLIKKALFVVTFICLGIHGTNLKADSSGAQFLNMGVGAQAQAFGNAYTAQVDNAAAVYWNPSALARLEKPGLFFYNTQFANDSTFSYASYARPNSVRNDGWGIAVGRVATESIESRDSARNSMGSFSASDQFLSLAYGKGLSGQWLAGGGITMMRSSIYTYSATGFALDLTSTYLYSPRTRLSAGIYHIGPNMVYLNQPYEMPKTLIIGIAHKVTDPATVTGDVQYRINEHKFIYSIGGEFKIGENIAIRSGYVSQKSQTKLDTGGVENAMNYLRGLGGGMGIKTFNRFTIDYAFVPLADMGNTHNFNFTWSFARN